ncbi:hypothetical protein ACS0TY_031849 [Phlomoides rotata]
MGRIVVNLIFFLEICYCLHSPTTPNTHRRRFCPSSRRATAPSLLLNAPLGPRTRHGSADSLQINQNNVIPQSTETTEHIVQPDCKPVSPSLEVNEQIHNGAEEKLSADIVARVSEAYHFDGMVDYQHVLTVHADSRRSKKRILADLESQLGGLMDVDQEDLMIILPPLFSLKDRPEKLIFFPSNSLRIEMEESGEGNGVKGQGICNTW